jgi:hypothetical protein
MALLSLAVTAAVGWFGVGLWVPGVGGRSPWAPVLRGSLGIGLGMGALSCLYFLLLIAGTANLPVVGAVEGFALLAAGGAHLIRRRQSAASAAAEELPAFPWNWALGLAAAGMAALFVASFLNVSELNPQGGWDAFAIWNLRAHYLTHSETWRYAVTAQATGAHMEYPLLLSSFIARGWLYDGGTSFAVPIAIALLVPLALAALLCSTLSVLRSTGVGLLAFSILLAHPGFLNAAADQYADLLLAFFGLSAGALLVLDPGPLRSPRYLTLAGWFAAFAAWTKNEGLLVVVALAAALLASAQRSSGWRTAIRQCGLFLLGALPVVVLVLWFKLFVAPPDPLAHGLGTGLLQKISDPGRWIRIAAGIVQGVPVVALLLVAFAAGLLRFLPAGQRRPGLFLPLIACAIVLAGDFAVFLLTPDELNWLLSTALERLYLQLWPLLLLAVFLLLRRPEDFAIAIAEAPAKRAAKSHRAH